MIGQAQEQPQKASSFSPVTVAFYSGLASIVGDVLVYPLDTIGTRIKANTDKFLNFKQGYKMIVNKEGVKGLYRGVSTTFAGAFVPYATYFFVYEWLNMYTSKLTQKFTHEKYSHLNLLIPLVSAPIAEVASVITYVPVDTIRTRMQMNSPEFNYRGAYHGLKEIHRKEGLIRLFQASHLYCGMIIIQTTFQLWFYELIRFAFLRRFHDKNEEVKMLRLHESLAATIISTIAAVSIVNPIDVIITRYQLVDTSVQSDNLNFMKLLRALIKKEGYTALFKGIGVRLGYNLILFSAQLPVYEYFKAKYGVTLDC